jgi:hypothetical protein
LGHWRRRKEGRRRKIRTGNEVGKEEEKRKKTEREEGG